MKINGLTNPAGAVATGTRSAETRRAPAQAATSASEEVHLSSTSADLSAASATVVDAARVHEIRQAIAEGRFQINPAAIADRLVSTARELVQAQRKA